MSKRSAIPSSLSPSAERSPDPHFTIAIPTFNRADWLRSCVASALSQTVESFEVVVSDNASDDATPEVLGEFDDERLSVIRQPRNIGAIGNWNACLSAANGTYVTMLSDDDSVAPFFLARCNSLITDDRRSLACRHSRRRLRRPYGLHATRHSESGLAIWGMARNRDTQGVPSRQHFAANVYVGHQDGGIASQRRISSGLATHRRSGELGSIAASREGRVHQRIMRCLPESLGDSDRPLCARNAT